MHYRNGREAKNGDKIVMLGGYGSGAQVVASGILYDAKPGNSHCNGSIAPIQGAVTGACLCDCLHVDDVAAMLAEKGLDKRPAGMLTLHGCDGSGGRKTPQIQLA
jgi:hypothetical protein